MRTSNGMGRVKYKSRYSSRRRVRRRKWTKRLLIILLIVAIVVGIAYLLGFLFNNISQNSKETVPYSTIEATMPAKTPAPHKRFTDKNLIGTWRGSEKINRGREINFTKRFGYIFIDEASFEGDAVKYYYVCYRDGAIEFMPYYTSDPPKTTIAPDGSDDIYLTKGQYVIEEDVLRLTINGMSYKYKRVIEATPTPVEEVTYSVDYENPVNDNEEEDTKEDEEDSQAKPKKKPTPKPTPKRTPKPVANQPAEDNGEGEESVDNEKTESGNSGANTEENTGEGVDDYDPAG